MSEQPPTPPTTQDFPDHWGFYLLQAINRLDDKIDAVRRDQEQTANALRQAIGGVRQEIHALDAKFDQKLTSLQYWYWSTLVVILVGFVTVLFAHV